MNTTETISDDFLQPASALTPSNRQRLFLRYFTAVLIDLVVLNLFVEYWSSVTIDSFTVSLFAAVVLQVLLKSTLALEHRIAAYFKSKQGGFAKFMRFFSAWLVLFGSKFVILGAIDFVFGDSVVFAGRLHGIVALIVILFAMLAAEEVVERFYRRLL
jgi:hypothetical protein